MTAFLPKEKADEARPVGWWQRIFGARRTPKVVDDQPLIIANDGPIDLDGQTKSAAMFEGELFGEMSCMTRMPRSATVRADRDVYLLEMLGNVLDMIRRDDGYRELTDRLYRERVLNLQLRTLPIFRQLDAEAFRLIQERAELVTYEPGSVVWDEHDAADTLCLVRGGLVKVVRGLHFVIGRDDVPQPQRAGVCQDLLDCSQRTSEPVHHAWHLLQEDEQAAARRLAQQSRRLGSPSRRLEQADQGSRGDRGARQDQENRLVRRRRISSSAAGPARKGGGLERSRCAAL